MSDKDLNHIFSLIFKPDIDSKKQDRIIEAIDTVPCAYEIALYVLRAAEMNFRRRGIVLAQEDILKVIDSKFCIDEACVYLDYLSNAHEPSHFLEETFKI